MAIDVILIRKRLIGALEGALRGVDQMLNDAVSSQGVGPVRKILPHQIFSEGKRRQRDVVGHLEAGHIPHRSAHVLHHLQHVDTLAVLRQAVAKIR